MKILNKEFWNKDIPGAGKFVWPVWLIIFFLFTTQTGCECFCGNSGGDRNYINGDQFGWDKGTVVSGLDGYTDGTYKFYIEDINGRTHMSSIGKLKYKSLGFKIREGDSIVGSNYENITKGIEKLDESEYYDSDKDFNE